MDDGSTDETAELVEVIAHGDPRIRLIRQANAGVAAARNRAIREARGIFIAPIDADDIWHPHKLERQVACMQAAGPRTGLVYTWWSIIDDGGSICVPSIAPSEEHMVFDALFRRNFIGNASVPLFRRSSLEEVGLYSTRMRAAGGQGCEDWDLALRVAERYAFRVVKECLVYYRKVEESMSTITDAMVRSHDIMLESAQERNPDLTPRLIRQSQAGFRRYIARTSYIDGDHLAALYWSWSSARLDWATMWSWKAAFVFATSIPLALLTPVTALIWPSRRTWLRLRRALFYFQYGWSSSASGPQGHQIPLQLPGTTSRLHGPTSRIINGHPRLQAPPPNRNAER